MIDGEPSDSVYSFNAQHPLQNFLVGASRFGTADHSHPKRVAAPGLRHAPTGFCFYAGHILALKLAGLQPLPQPAVVEQDRCKQWQLSSSRCHHGVVTNATRGFSGWPEDFPVIFGLILSAYPLGGDTTTARPVSFHAFQCIPFLVEHPFDFQYRLDITPHIESLVSSAFLGLEKWKL